LVVLFGGCRKRKSVEVVPVAAAQPPEPAQESAPAVAPKSNQPPPADVPTIETGVEFGDLNNMIEGFIEARKRPPTLEELKKLYYGGTRPLPIPPGYRLVIDPNSKKAKLVR
jgi:hypothetical protein